MTNEKKTKWTAKRIAALTAVVLLVALYLVTFFVAVFAPVEAGNIFAVCLMGTITIPLLAWIYIWMYGRMTGKETIADLKILQTGIEAQEAGPVDAEMDAAELEEAEQDEAESETLTESTEDK